MKSYPELMAQFYDEFPEAMGFVTFRHAKRQYPDVEDNDCKSMKEKLHRARNFALRNSIGTSCVVGTNGEPAFTKSILGVFNRFGQCSLGPVEEAFIFYHESYHALQQMNQDNLKSGLSDVHREECEADAYATMRVMHDYGLDAIPFMQCVADWRIEHFFDVRHVTTFSVDRAIELSIGLQEMGFSNQCQAQSFLKLAHSVVDGDILQKIIGQNSHIDKENWIEWGNGIPNVNIEPDICPQWFIDRRNRALMKTDIIETVTMGLKHVVAKFDRRQGANPAV